MSTDLPSPQRRREIVDALRRGTVPRRGLDAFAVGVHTFVTAIDEELAAVIGGAGQFKAIRGEYGSGKTFFGRWLAERAKDQGLWPPRSRSPRPRPRCTAWRPSIDGSLSSCRPATSRRALYGPFSTGGGSP